MGQYSRLEYRHAKLEEQIQDEQKRPLPDDIVIRQLKKEKLAVKDQLIQRPRMS